MALVERINEASALADAVQRAADGAGSTVFLAGAPGIGKTALMNEAIALAESAGMTVLRACAVELEAQLGFCVARDLLTHAVDTLNPMEQARVLGGAAGLAAGPLGLNAGRSVELDQALYGIYWVCANLADRGPLMLAVDDAQWADESSLAALCYVARRIAGHPIVLCVASRPAVGEPRELELNALMAAAGRVLDVRPLSVAGVRQIVEARFESTVAAEFSTACAEASGGNPFLLMAALDALAVGSTAPTAEAAESVTSVSPASLAATVSRRIARCGTAGDATSRAIVVLGPDANARRIAALAEITVVEAAAAVSALRREGVLAATRSVDFIHPLVRNAASSLLSELTRGLMHLQAARLLESEGEGDDAVARHLLPAAATGDPWVVDWLVKAADRARSGGATGYAARLLRRALEEPPARADVRELTLNLGRAELASHQLGDAERHLRIAMELADSPQAKAEAAVEVSRVLVNSGRALDGLDMLDRVLTDPSIDVPTRMALEAERAIASFMGASATPAFARIESVVPAATGMSLGECWARAAYAYAAGGTGKRPADEVLSIARSARPLTGPFPPHLQHILAVCLTVGGAYEAAVVGFDVAIESCRTLGDANYFTFMSGSRAMTELRRGRVDDAEADAFAALAAASDQPSGIGHGVSIVVLCLLEKDRLDEAEAVLAEHGLSETTEPWSVADTWLYSARGRVHKLRGRLAAALADFERSRDVAMTQGFGNPAFGDWHAHLALTHAALGATDVARELAAADLAAARRFGAPREIGRGLRVCGLLEGNGDGLELLAESVEVLASSEARLDEAESLIAYGAALRRAGRRPEAIKYLSSGLDVASECGSRALLKQARAELRVAGARPRRERLTGIDALTASERRIASMAAAGQSNPEIAQALFITRHTVEAHLTSVFRKLGIDGRQHVARALGAEWPGDQT